MNHIQRAVTLQVLQARQNAIVFESDEDEGAMEHWGEINSVIDKLVDPNASDSDIVKAAEHVGLESDLRYRGGVFK